MGVGMAGVENVSTERSGTDVEKEELGGAATSMVASKAARAGIEGGNLTSTGAAMAGGRSRVPERVGVAVCGVGGGDAGRFCTRLGSVSDKGRKVISR